MKRSLTSLVTRRMEIKTTVRDIHKNNYIPARMTEVRKDNIKC